MGIDSRMDRGDFFYTFVISEDFFENEIKNRIEKYSFYHIFR